MKLVDSIKSLFTHRDDSTQRVAQAVEMMQRVVRGTYDAARDSVEFQNYWGNTDTLDADSAHSKAVRHTLIRRSRYEVANNGYSDGIAQTSTTDLIGNGPTLRMQTGSNPFNAMVEFQFYLWCQATGFSRKLWCMAHAKHVDGEAIAVLRRNPGLNHRIPLDVVLIEAEQCQTPLLPLSDLDDGGGYIDGIRFDRFGNPVWYDILHDHPGTSNSLRLDLTPEKVPAEFVLHWFKMRRPGQHRGVPEMASTLNLGAAFRRLREASLSTAEKVAAWTLFLKTAFPPDQMQLAPQPVAAMSTIDIVRGMITALPNTVEPFQLTAEQPGPQYDAFHDKLLSEQARPKSMPRNKAACDSSSYNYASGRLDHQTYYAALDVEREDCNSLVLDRLFNVWFDVAISRFGWLGGNPEAVGPGARVHTWDWPKHRVADVEAEANANKTKLTSGQIFPHRLFADAGLDFDDEVAKAVESFGVPEEELRRRLFDVMLPPPKNEASPSRVPAPVPAADAVLSRLNGHSHAVNGNGSVHAN